MTKLLLAEGDEFSRNMLARRLQRSGFETITAVDGRDALLAARRDRPDVILLDLDIPVMDGYAVMRSLATDPRTFKIPLIVLTARGKPEDVAQAIELGCHAYEVKPVPLRRLLERIEEALGSRAAAKAAEAKTHQDGSPRSAPVAATPAPGAPAGPVDPGPVP